MTNNNIICTIITYNPDLALFANNIHLLVLNKNILIIDNGSINQREIENIIVNLSNSQFYKLYFIKLNKNYGIAYALNIGLEYCKRHSINWMYTFDQDSTISVGFFEKMEFHLNSGYSLVAPKIIDKNVSNIYKNKKNTKNAFKLRTFITSGSLINVGNSISVGGFEEKLFIDYVDHEFCLKLVKNGYTMFHENKAQLFHEVGKITEKNLFFLKIHTTNHLPWRRYFIFRNKIYVQKKYFFRFPEWVVKDVLSSFKLLIIIIIFEKKKKENIRNILLGVYDGILNNFSRAIEYK